MKNLLLISAIVFCSQLSFSQADLKLGINGGFPVGDSSSFTDLSWGVDAAYLYNFAGIFQGGPLLGYTSFVGESGYGNLAFLPFAASGRVNLPVFDAGLDLGYAIGLEGGTGGGFFYRPKVGIGMRFFDLIASYSGISSGDEHFSSVNLGVEISL